MDAKDAPNAISEQSERALQIFIGYGADPKNYKGCTGFLIDHNTLMTAGHCMSNIERGTKIELAWMNSGNFKIENFKNETIFDSAKKSDRISKLDYPCKPSIMAGEGNFKEAEIRCDFMFIHLSRSLGVDPIPFAKSPPAKGDSVYVVGYPAKTKVFRNFGYMDSDGKGLLISRNITGPATDISWETRREQYRFSHEAENWYLENGGDNWLLKHLSNSFVASSLQTGKIWSLGDCYSGMSGGPILNEKGEWVGLLVWAIYAKVEPSNKKKLMNGYCVGVTPQWIKSQPKLSVL
jgi:hypothetical protein